MDELRYYGPANRMLPRGYTVHDLNCSLVRALDFVGTTSYGLKNTLKMDIPMFNEALEGLFEALRSANGIPKSGQEFVSRFNGKTYIYNDKQLFEGLSKYKKDDADSLDHTAAVFTLWETNFIARNPPVTPEND